MLKTRIITSLWAIPLIIAAIWFDEPLPWFTVLVAVAGLLGGLEFFRITGVIRNIPLTIFGIAGILYFIISAHFGDYRYLLLVLVAGAALSLSSLIFIRLKENVFTSWALMIGGVLYVGWLLHLLVSLRSEARPDWIFLALFATFGSDTAAYFIGKYFGKHKLTPRISPNKTWEGAIAGLAGAVIVSLLFMFDSYLHLEIAYWQAILLGLLISVFGQIGDLVESLLKRSFSVKDSGKLMPGHGGILDRLDSILFAGVVVYIYYYMVVV